MDGADVQSTHPTRSRPGVRPRARRWAGTLRTIGLYLVTALAVATFIFVLPRAMPGDPLAVLDDPDSGQFLRDDEVRAIVMSHYGLDRPLPSQYVDYLGGIATLDLGWSIARNAPVASLIGQHLPWTLLLMGCGLTLASLISYLAGIHAAWRRGRADDRILVMVLTASRAMPEFVLASVLLLVFAVIVPVFPLFGNRTFFASYSSWLDEARDIAYHLVLPLTALTLGLVGSKFLLVRNTVIGALGQDFMVAARAKGLPMRIQKHRHAGRNALLPFLTVLGIQAAYAVGGTIFVETVFTYPGMGALILDAVTARDYPVLEGTFLVLAVAVLAVNLLVDLVYARLDPRVGAS